MKKNCPTIRSRTKKKEAEKKITITEQNREIIKRSYFSFKSTLTNFQPFWSYHLACFQNKSYFKRIHHFITNFKEKNYINYKYNPSKWLSTVKNRTSSYNSCKISHILAEPDPDPDPRPDMTGLNLPKIAIIKAFLVTTKIEKTQGSR